MEALYTSFTVSNSISCSIVSQPSTCISGSEGASKQLLLLYSISVSKWWLGLGLLAKLKSIKLRTTSSKVLQNT